MSQAKHDFVPFHVPMCSDKLQEIARTELGETEDLKENCLQQLRLLIRAFWNPNICSPHELITLFFLMGTYVASNKSSQTTGLAYVIDLKSMSLLHASLFLSTVNRWRNFCFNCIPIRYASGHIVSDSIIIKYATLLVLPIVPKKIRDRFVFHKDFGASFYEYFPRDILPDNFGGTIGPLDCERQIQVMRDELQKLKDEIHYFQHRT